MTRALDLLRRRWLPLTLALAALVAWLSLIPETRMPGPAKAHDKVEHLIAYAALAFPAAFARPRGWPWVLAAVAAFSAGIELVQPLAGRAASLADLAMNMAGVGIGLAAASVLRRLPESRT